MLLLLLSLLLSVVVSVVAPGPGPQPVISLPDDVGDDVTPDRELTGQLCVAAAVDDSGSS